MKQLIYHPLVIIFFTLVTAVITYTLYKNTQEIKNSTRSIQLLENQIQEKEANMVDLENQLDQASSDFTQEKIIRNELLLQKDGEYIVQISKKQEDIDPSNSAGRQKTEEKVKENSPWQEWWELIWE